MPRLIMHLDLDAFYAAVEQRDRPEWRGLPLVVGAAPGGRGVVATCSYEARRFGVRSAMPIAEAARRLPPETVYVRPDMPRYARESRRIIAALGQISPLLEQVSIDEAYLDVSGLGRLIGPPEAIGRRAKALIQDAVGLSASVGIGPNRLIAKLASEQHKPNGLTVVPAEARQAFLDPLPVSALRGVGAKTLPRLQALGLATVADLRRVPLATLRRRLGARAGTLLHQQARGIADDRVYPDTTRKSISKETTFAEDVTEPAILRETLRWAAQEVGFIARAEARLGTVVTLKVRLRGFETHTCSRTLAVPSADDRVIFGTAWSLFEAGTWQRRPVRLIGVGLAGWNGTDLRQLSLFDEAGAAESATGDAGRDPRTAQRLQQTLDAIRNRYGPGALGRGLRRPRDP